MFQPVDTSNFELGLKWVLYIVVGFDAPLAWSYQPKEHSRVLKILSEWKYETFWGDLAPITQGSRPSISYSLVETKSE